MNRYIVLPVLLVALCSAAFAQKVVIKGSNTFGEELAPRLIAGFAALRPDVAVDLESKGSGAGIAALLDGACDIASSSRAMTEDEMRKARSRHVTLRNHTIGYYGVSVVVHPANPVKNLTDRQVCDLFTGAVTNWKEVGGADLPIHVFIRDPASGTHLGFQELATERRPYVTSARPFTSYLAMADAVKQDPSAVGYLGVNLPDRAGVKELTIGGVAPSVRNVADQSYPYARQLRLYTDQQRETAEAAAFITFVRSVQGQRILDRLGFVTRYQLKLPSSGELP